jgi:hypothetical protein
MTMPALALLTLSQHEQSNQVGQSERDAEENRHSVNGRPERLGV